MESTTVPAASRERLLERVFSVDAGTVVGNQRVGGLDAVLRGPCAHRRADLRQRHRRAGDVRRLGRDDGRCGVEDDHRLLGLRGDVGDRQRLGRQSEAGQEVDFVAHHQFLRQALGHLRGGPTRVADEHFHLAAGNRRAVDLLERLDARIELLAVVGERPGKRSDDSNPDGVLRPCRQREQQTNHRNPENSLHSAVPPKGRRFAWTVLVPSGGVGERMIMPLVGDWCSIGEFLCDKRTPAHVLPGSAGFRLARMASISSMIEFMRANSAR